MDASQRVNWLDMSPKQIEDVQNKKRDADKEESKHILGSLNALENSLLKCIACLSSAERNLINGGDECTTPFIQNISNYINGLAVIGNISSSLDNISFPIALCDYLDQGLNPDLHMKQNYNVTQSRNNLQRARIVNTFALEQYLRQGQAHFEKETNQKDELKSMKDDIDEDEDDDIAMK